MGASTSDEGLLSNSGDGKIASKAELKVSDCLESYDYDYARMLTLDDIGKYHDVDLSIVEKKDGGIKGEYGSVDYTWPSDRPDIKMEISKMVMNVPDKNSVMIKMPSFYDDNSAQTVEFFSRGYKELSKRGQRRRMLI